MEPFFVYYHRVVVAGDEVDGHVWVLHGPWPFAVGVDGESQQVSGAVGCEVEVAARVGLGLLSFFWIGAYPCLVAF